MKNLDVISVLQSFTSEQWYFIFINFFVLCLEISSTVVSSIIAWRCFPKIIDLIAHRLANKSVDK